MYAYAGNNPIKYTDPDGRETYDSDITKEQYDNSSFLRSQMSWDQVQEYFASNPNAVLHRPGDQFSFMKLENKKEIVDINDGSMLMLDALLIGKGLISLGKSLAKFFASHAAKSATKEAIIIGGRDYSKHALERMEQRKLVPMIVEETIKRGVQSPGNTPGTTVYLTDEAKVILNEAGKVITVMAK